MGIRFHNPAFLWFLLSLIPLTLFYIYLTRREQTIVPSLQVWRSTQSTDAHLLNRPLKRFLEWLLASLFVLFIVLQAAGIHLQTSSSTRTLLLLVDNSSSMIRTDDGPTTSTLLEKSVDNIHQLLGDLPEQVRWRIYQLAPSPRLTDRGTGPVHERRLGQISSAPLEASETRIHRFMNSLLTNVEQSASGLQSYLYTDQQLSALPALLKRHPELQMIPVGGPAGNVAITDASLERRWNGQLSSIHVDLHNYSDSSRSFPVRLHGLTKKNRQTSISAGASKHIRIPVTPGTPSPEQVGIVMDTADPFPTDNGAYFRRKPQQTIPVRIDLPPPSNRFTRSAVRSAGPSFSLEPEDADAEHREKTGGNPGPEPIRLLETTPDSQPEPGTISFLRSTDNAKRQTVQQPVSSSGSSKLTTGLDFHELNLQSFVPLQRDPDETCLLTSGEHCLAVLSSSEEKRPYVRFGFALSDSNFTLLPEFPVLLHRILDVFRQRLDRSNAGSFTETQETDSHTSLKRTWLRPDGGLEQQQINRPATTSRILPPGWYEAMNQKGNRTLKPVNFFHPNESRMNRTSPIVERRISSSSPPSHETPADSFPFRIIVLLMTLLTWSGFLILSVN